MEENPLMGKYKSRGRWITLRFSFTIGVFAWLVIASTYYRLIYIPVKPLPSFERISPAAPIVALESEHFILKSPQGYMSEAQLAGLLARAEEIRAELLAFLEPPPQDDGKKITIRLSDEPGMSRIAGTRLIYLHLVREGRLPLVHEVTHVLMGNSASRLLHEGLAVYTQERFGHELAFPNFSMPVNWCILKELSKATLLPLLNLHKGMGFYGGSRKLAYLQAGSFTKYLIKRYGYAKFRDAYYSGDYKYVYGQSLSELERGWVASLQRFALLILGMRVATGLLCLVIAHLALVRKTPLWWLTAAIAPLAGAIFKLYLHWRLISRQVLGLAVAALYIMPTQSALGIAAVVLLLMLLGNRLAQKWSQTMLWSFGMLLLSYYVLLPMVRVLQALRIP